MNDLSIEYNKAKRALFERVYREKLNPQQMQAVFIAKGPLLVLAGAGSGKTTVLVNRILYLIRYGNAYHSDYCPEEVTEETVSALKEAVNYDVSQIEEILPEFIMEPVSPWSVLAITFTNKAAREIRERLDSAFLDKNVSDSIWAGTFHSVCIRILHKFGDKIGYGGGFYDRFLCDLDCKKIVCISREFILETVCAEPHDIKMDKIIFS